MDEQVEIQVKMAWLEKQVAELDAVVRGLGDELSAVRRELRELRANEATRGAAELGDDADAAGPAFEKPPHY